MGFSYAFLEVLCEDLNEVEQVSTDLSGDAIVVESVFGFRIADDLNLNLKVGALLNQDDLVISFLLLCQKSR